MRRARKRAACPECGREMTLAGLSNHIKMHRIDDLPDLTCAECPRTFKFEGAWIKHQMAHELRRQKFWTRVDKNGPNGCWLFKGKTRRGYGRVSFGRGHDRGAHQFAYEELVGPVPKDKPELDHLCMTPACVNPAHLEPVTHEENMRRAHKALRVDCPFCDSTHLPGALAGHIERKHQAVSVSQSSEDS